MTVLYNASLANTYFLQWSTGLHSLCSDNRVLRTKISPFKTFMSIWLCDKVAVTENIRYYPSLIITWWQYMTVDQSCVCVVCECVRVGLPINWWKRVPKAAVQHAHRSASRQYHYGRIIYCITGSSARYRHSRYISEFETLRPKVLENVVIYRLRIKEV